MFTTFLLCFLRTKNPVNPYGSEEGSVGPDGILLDPISFIRVSENPVNLWIWLSGSESEGCENVVFSLCFYNVLLRFYYVLLRCLRT